MKTFAMLTLLSVFLALPLAAQNLYEFGGAFDPSTTPRFKGMAGFLTPLGSTGSTYSYSTALVNKPVSGAFTYSLVTGIRRKLPINPILGVTLWADAQGGMAASTGATSGAFLGGVVATRPIQWNWAGKNLGWFLSGKAFVIPVGGGVTVQVMAGIQFTP